MPTSSSLRDQVALVTGAASGIGLATAHAFARAGARVVLADRSADALPGAAAAVAADAGGADRVAHIAADVSRDPEVRAMVAHTVATFGRLDVAVNNAGIEGTLAPTADQSDDDWDRVVAINLTGVFRCMRAEIAALRAHGNGGAIVNVSSILGQVGFASAPAYTAAKHGVLGLTRTAALELAAERIRVTAICPGFIETPMVMERGVHLAGNAAGYAQAAALHPLGRLGTADEVAEAIVWMASPAASFVTGTALAVDGGYLAR